MADPQHITDDHPPKAEGGAPMQLRIVLGLSEAQRGPAARLYWQAFGSKLERVMGPAPRALRFIEDVICPDHVLACVGVTGEVLGVAGFRTAEGSFVGGSFDDLVRVYGRTGALWRDFCLRLVGHDASAQILFIDGLAVDAAWRSQGIGTALLKALCAFAQTRGYRELRLDVAEENTAAAALYARLGFEPKTKRTVPLSRFLFRFGRLQVMGRML